MPAKTSVKICGLSTAPTLHAALDAGADMVGFVFFARSPRNLTVGQAAELVSQVEHRAITVALVVDAQDEAIDTIMRMVKPDMLQLHGRETPERVSAIKALTGVPVMKAIGIASKLDLAMIPALAAVADRLLLDAKPPPGSALPGGNGATFDWSLVAGVKLDLPWMLSGGLTPANVAGAIAATHAPGVDVSSGVESASGSKDIGLIRAFVAAAKA